jgi:hypothetical protein
MLLDGSSSTQHHLLEPENFYGKKVIQLMSQKKTLPHLLEEFLMFMLTLMNNFLLFHAARVESLRMKLSQEHTFPKQLKFMFLNQEEESKVLLLIN